MSSKDEELSPEELTALLGSFMPEIPGYRVLRRIGKGGMSQVYLGVQESLDRQVAIKIMDPSALADEVTKQRFEQEARTIAKLEHPCIVGIHEVGRTPQGLLYYVLPYLAKGHLGQKEFSKDEKRIIEVLRALLSALEYAHSRGIVHRDVKAENVLFDNADRPLLTDFGIALARRDTSRITSAGIAVGSGGYMAPEQARGEAVDGRADLYAVGVLAFELLTGHLPFQSTDPLGLALMHAQDPIPRLPPERKHWQAFVDRAMAKSPENRYRNAQLMLAALNEVVNAAPEPLTAAPDPGQFRAPRRNLLQPVVIGLAALVLAGGGYVLYQRLAKPDKAPDFYTGSDAPAATTNPPAGNPTAAVTPAAVNGSDAATTSTAPTDPAGTDPASIAPPPVAIEPEVTETTATQGVGSFGSVTGSASYTVLDYDPTVAGARQLAAAKRQMAQKRLSAPPGDNVLESLLALRRLAPQTPELQPLSDQLVNQLAMAVTDALKAGRDDAARTAYPRAQKAAKDLGRVDSAPWQKLRSDLVAPLVSRLERATSAQDRAAIERAKSLASALELSPAQLEPAWSAARINTPKAKPGDLLRGEGPAMVLVTAPDEGRSGFAMMREEVSRAEYAAFASATGRSAGKCSNRLTQLFSGKQRDWNDPGFSQTGQHPVVCVSHADAQAYAQWLSQRTGQRYRLPTSSEWQRVASYGGASEPCSSGHISCGARGTTGGGEFPASPLGLHDLQGNVSEWLADAGGAGKYLAAGASWRDVPARAKRAAQATPGDRGHDDIGFRLVREVSASELGQ